MTPSTRRFVHLALAAIPFVMMLVLAPLLNRATPFVLGLPFLLFWIVLSVVVTSVCMTIVYLTDPANKSAPSEPTTTRDAARPSQGGAA